MARRLFFVEQVRNARAEIQGEDAHHLTRALRVEAGQAYEISDNQSLYLAEVETARKDRVVFRVVETLPWREEPVRIALFASLIKFDRFEWIVEKATELGVDTITPVKAVRSEKGLAEAALKRLPRWRKIALESCQQARRPRLPVIKAPESFPRAAREEIGWRYFLDEQPGAPPLVATLPDTRPPGASIALLVGPEGGWTGEERAAALAVGWQAVSLGGNVLRAETAAVAALAIVQNAWAAQLSIPICVRR